MAPCARAGAPRQPDAVARIAEGIAAAAARTAEAEGAEEGRTAAAARIAEVAGWKAEVLRVAMTEVVAAAGAEAPAARMAAEAVAPVPAPVAAIDPAVAQSLAAPSQLPRPLLSPVPRNVGSLFVKAAHPARK